MVAAATTYLIILIQFSPTTDSLQSTESFQNRTN